MLLIGLTGNIAAGKSTLAHAFAERGALVIDSDLAAREAVAPGTPGLRAIIATFGSGMLTADGSLDRARLGRRVFDDVAARRVLESIVHPAVEASRQRAVRDARAAGRPVVVCDIPLLFEAHLAWQFPRIILVDAPCSIRISRLVHDRGMSQGDAAARIASQMPATLKRPRADLVVDNDGDRATLAGRIVTAWDRVRRWSLVAGTGHAA